MFSTSSTASSSVTEAPRRMFVPTWTWAKPTWPNPELSIGRELEALDGSHKCWETVGPVLELENSIWDEVKRLLDLRWDYLIEGERIVDPLLFRMYMIGRRKEEANPTLLFSCSRLQPRKRAKEVVKQSRILQDHPAIRLAHSKRPPQALRPFRLLVGPMKGVQRGEVETFGEVYCISPVDRTCGVPVFMRRKDGSFRKATIGGIVQLDDTYYGLTVAHTFVDDGFQSIEESDDDFSDMECSFDSDDDLSRSSEDGRASRIEEPQRHPGHDQGYRTSREFSSFRTATLSKALQHIDEDQASSSVVGNLFQYSTHTGLDWALIEIDTSRVDPKTCNAVTLTNEYEERTLWPRALVTTGPAKREVLAITGDKGVIQGSLSQSSMYMRTAHTRGFQELWTIHMRSSLAEGDCGSWVVDRENGQLYGQIVAGHPGTGVGYIIPASQIFESVWQTLGDALILPSGTSTKPGAPITQAQQDFPSQRPNSPIPRRQTTPSPKSFISIIPGDTRQRIQDELEYIFSDHNLTKDFRLRSYMDSEGFIGVVPLTFNSRLSNVNATPALIRAICESLPFLEITVGKDGFDRVRRRSGWAKWVLPYEQRDMSLRISDIAEYKEVTHMLKARPREWEKGFDDVSGSMASHSVARYEYVKAEPYYQPSKFDAGREEFPTYSSLAEIRRRESNRGKEREAAAVSTPYEDPNDKAIARVLHRNEKDTRKPERRDPSPIDPGRPVYTRMSRRHLSLETLRFHGIDHEVDLADPDYILIKRWVPEHEQDALWEHTRRIRSSNILSRPAVEERRNEFQSQSSSGSFSETDSELETIRKELKVREIGAQRRGNTRASGRKQNVPGTNIHEPKHPATSPRIPNIERVAPQQPLAYDSLPHQPEVALPEGWISHLDETSGNPYYIHVPTQAVQWEFPGVGSVSQPDQSSFPREYGRGWGDNEYDATEVDPTIEEIKRFRDDRGPFTNVSDSKKSRGAKSKQSKSSSKGSTNVSEIGSEASSAKQKARDSNANPNPLLMFLAGGKKR